MQQLGPNVSTQCRIVTQEAGHMLRGRSFGSQLEAHTVNASSYAAHDHNMVVLGEMAEEQVMSFSHFDCFTLRRVRYLRGPRVVQNQRARNIIN